MNCISTCKWYMWSHHTQECAWLFFVFCSLWRSPPCQLLRLDLNLFQDVPLITSGLICTSQTHHAPFFTTHSQVLSKIQSLPIFRRVHLQLHKSQWQAKPNLNIQISASNPCCTRLNTASAGGNISLHSPVSVAWPPMASWSLGKSGKMRILHSDSEPSPVSS